MKPLWEEKENLDGGCWVIKVRREDGKATRLWEEICLLACGGELQVAVSLGTKMSAFRLSPTNEHRTRSHPRIVLLATTVLGTYIHLDKDGLQPKEY